MENRRIPSKNELFRFFECKLSIEETCKLCDVNQKTVKKWDEGKPIPAYYERLMKQYAGLELDHLGWKGWKFQKGMLISPLGFKIQPEMIEYWAISNTPELSNREVMQREIIQQIRKRQRR